MKLRWKLLLLILIVGLLPMLITRSRVQKQVGNMSRELSGEMRSVLLSRSRAELLQSVRSHAAAAQLAGGLLQARGAGPGHGAGKAAGRREIGQRHPDPGDRPRVGGGYSVPTARRRNLPPDSNGPQRGFRARPVRGFPGRGRCPAVHAPRVPGADQGFFRVDDPGR